MHSMDCLHLSGEFQIVGVEFQKSLHKNPNSRRRDSKNFHVKFKIAGGEVSKISMWI